MNAASGVSVNRIFGERMLCPQGAPDDKGKKTVTTAIGKWLKALASNKPM